ncbi:MAG: cold-shock protein [Bryobacteraceae bacterium]
MDGIVRRFDSRRGFGWITPLIGSPDSTTDVWFHISAVRNAEILPGGCRVSFKIVDAPGGRVQAASVVPYTRTLAAQERRREQSRAERQEAECTQA